MDVNTRRNTAEVKRSVFWFASVLSVPVALTIGIVVYGLVSLSDSLGGDECPLGYFRCGELAECVAQEHQCDWHPHCSNGADEDTLLCADNEGYLQVFGELFFKSKTTHFDYCVLDDYPSACHCSAGSILNCLEQNLTTVPQPLPGNTTRLFLSHNRLVTVPARTFQHLNVLEKLFLKSNNIEKLEPGCFSGLGKLEFLLLSSNKITTIRPGVLDSLDSLKHLDLTDNSISIHRTDVLYLPGALEILNLERNHVSEIGERCFQKTQKLRILLLASNDLTFVHPMAFSALRDLVEINLGDNNLRGLDSAVLEDNTNLKKIILDGNPIEMSNVTALIRPTTSLKSLSLKNIKMSEPQIEAFTRMENLTYATFTSHRYCRYAPQAQVCYPKGDGISSVRNMLDHMVHRVCIWVIAIVTLSGNLLVIVCRILWREESDVHAFFIKNLCAADLMTGLFLVLVAVYDLLLRDMYNRHALWWVNSWTCTAAGVLGVVASEVSVAVLAFMSFERSFTISHPYRTRLVTLPRAKAVMLALWGTSVLLALLPLTSERAFGRFYVTNAMCFPLFLEAPYSSGWQYSVFILVGVNFTALLLVCYSYSTLFYSIRRSQAQSCVENRPLTMRLLLIVFINFACIVPVVIIKLLALANIPVSENVHAWVTVFVLPLNSSCNPLVYTVTTPPFCRKVRHVIHSRLDSLSESWSRTYEMRLSIAKSPVTVQPCDQLSRVAVHSKHPPCYSTGAIGKV